MDITVIILVALLLVCFIVAAIFFYKWYSAQRRIEELRLKLDSFNKALLEKRNSVEDDYQMQLKKENRDKAARRLIAFISAIQTFSNYNGDAGKMLEELDKSLDLLSPNEIFKNGKENLISELGLCIKAYERIMLLQKKVTLPFLKGIDQEPAPTEEHKVKVRGAILRMAMQLYDGVDSFNSVNEREEQRLNLNVVEGKMEIGEAMAKSELISTLSHKSPRWARNIKKGVEGIGVEDENVIFSGYKLK